jgi:hypothetical protein
MDKVERSHASGCEMSDDEAAFSRARTIDWALRPSGSSVQRLFVCAVRIRRAGRAASSFDERGAGKASERAKIWRRFCPTARAGGRRKAVTLRAVMVGGSETTAWWMWVMFQLRPSDV